jgi:ABC-type glycerol-3-phosphate transport system permease component
MTMSRRGRQRAKSITMHLIALLATLLMLAPLTWVVVTSLRPLEDIIELPPRIIPARLTLQAYRDMWDRAPLFKFVRNSVIVSLSTAVIALVFSILAAYAFTRFRFRGARLLIIFVLISQSLPGTSILLPLFRTIQELGMIDTRRGLILVYTGFVVPFSTWLLMGYFRSIPLELEDAARVDGASRLQVLFRIVVPLSAPAIVAVGAFSFLAAWNEFLFGFILTRDRAPTIAVGLVTSYFSQYVNLWNQVAAASIVFSLPPVLLFLLVQRQFISGLTAGAVKG